MTLQRVALATFGIIVGFLFSVGSATTVVAQSRLTDAELAKALVRGGHVIVMRHAAADPDKADTDPLNFANIRRQQPLTEGGKASARAFGEAMRRLGVKFEAVLTSRFNRAVQTAVLAGFADPKPSLALTEGSLVVSPNENRNRAVMLRQIMGQPVTPGFNRLLISHRANLAQALGREWYEVKEGEASIFKVDNGAYTLVARVQIDEWPRIASQGK
ncbi:MAG TPA: histidine phosphatase family protein [Hyphomicrobiaceae bacterium]|nr:histidine phosphatase family protein [Hyphomicrobiaceae bacterium]